MGKAKTILNGIITFITLAVAPIYSIQILERYGITIPNFDAQTVLILGVIVTLFTIISGLTERGVGAVMTFIKYLASAYYSYRVMNMFTYFIMDTPQAYAELIIDWGLWLILVITITLLSGIIAAIGKLAEEKKEEKRK